MKFHQLIFPCFLFSLLTTALLHSCANQPSSPSSSASASPSSYTYPTKNYLEVAHYFDTVKNTRFPYVIHLKEGKKELVFIGTAHTRDVTQQADSIDFYFNLIKPQIAFNEGGQIAKEKHYTTRNDAIANDAEIGQLKYLCDQQKIEMINGDLSSGEEMEALFKQYGREQVLLYTCCERFFALYKNGWIDTTKGIEAAYQKDFIQYLESEKLQFQPEEKKFNFMKIAYKKIFGTELDVYNVPVEKYSFLKDGGRLCEVGRSSKMVRDEHLLKTIETAFKTNDRIFVAFGGAHAVAIEPALNELMKKIQIH